MSDQILFVDLERLQSFGLAKAPPNARINIFVGLIRTQLPTPLVKRAPTLGSHLQWVRKQ